MTTVDMTPLAVLSARTRADRAELRAAVYAGERSLYELLCPVHPDVADMALVDLVRWQYRNPASCAIALEKIGRDALRERVNLLQRAGTASARTRAWVAAHGSQYVQRRGGE